MSAKTFSKIGLSTTPYEWQHVTFILEYGESGVFKYHYYVNGKHTISGEDTIAEEEAWLALNGDHSKLSVGYYRMYPSNSESKNGKIGLDNFKITYFSAEYREGESDFTQIATYHYNENYELPYKYTVAKVDSGNGEVAFFDDINEAVESAKTTDIVRICENITTEVVVDKEIKIDLNVYDSNGNATGELYTFNYKSNTNLVLNETESGSGIFVFSKNSVNVIWDEFCSSDCNCYADFGGHKMNLETVVGIGQVPSYSGEIPAPVVNGAAVTSFVGWSYTKGGEVEALREITAADVENGFVKLYPVYKTEIYDFEYIDGEKNRTFFYENDFEEVLATLVQTNGAKLILHSDIEYHSSVEFSSEVTSTLDLNGHTLTRINLYGNTYHYDPSTKEYVAGEAAVSELNSFTTTGGKNINFTITSSGSQGTFYVASIEGTIWYDENGNVEKYEGTTAGYGGFFYASKSVNTTLNTSNISIFAIDILYSSWGTTSNLSLNVTNCNFYKTTGVETTGKTGYGCIYIDSINTVKVNLKDSLFYIPAATVINGQQQFIRALEKGTVNITVDNCDIISDNDTVTVTLPLDSHYAIFTNCRIYNIKNSSTTFTSTIGNGTVSTSKFVENANLDEGFSLIAAENKIKYSLPTLSRIVIDSETKLPSFDFYFAERELVFTYEVKPSAEFYASVVWLDESGNIIESSHVLKNSVAIAPRYVVNLGDGYRGIVVTKWLDGSGAISNLEIGQENEYIFKANPVVDNETEYTARITSAQFNLLFYTNFSTLIYLPVDTEMSAPTVSGFTILEHTVKICGTEY